MRRPCPRAGRIAAETTEDGSARVRSWQGGADQAGGADAREGELMREEKWTVAMGNITGRSGPPADPFPESSKGSRCGRWGPQEGMGVAAAVRQAGPRGNWGKGMLLAHGPTWGRARHTSSQQRQA
jgi:hypothetical protein